MGILLALIAGFFMPMTNFTVRKSIDIGGTAKGYFVTQMVSSFFFSILFGPCWKKDFSISFPAALLGASAGAILSLMLFSLGKALEKGPPGFTFSILNSATVMPGLLMALFFGSSLGYGYTAWHGLGSLFVLGGLFWAGKGLEGMKEGGKWLFFSTGMFFLHVFLLALYQWRGMLLNAKEAQDLFPFFPADQMNNESFAPFMFLVSALIQGTIYFFSPGKKLQKGEAVYGFAGGLTNLLCTFFLLAAAEKATPLENAVIFPIFSVVGIILTNAWGQKLYQESVNWRACQVSLFGLILGTVDWKAVTAAIASYSSF